MNMNSSQLKQYIILVSILIVITALAVVGILQLFNAADEARHGINVSQCQNIVLGEAVHNFHVSIAKIELAEGNKPLQTKLLKDALNEPDIAFAMKACKIHDFQTP